MPIKLVYKSNELLVSLAFSLPFLFLFILSHPFLSSPKASLKAAPLRKKRLLQGRLVAPPSHIWLQSRGWINGLSLFNCLNIDN